MTTDETGSTAAVDNAGAAAAEARLRLVAGGRMRDGVYSVDAFIAEALILPSASARDGGRGFAAAAVLVSKLDDLYRIIAMDAGLQPERDSLDALSAALALRGAEFRVNEWQHEVECLVGVRRVTADGWVTLGRGSLRDRLLADLDEEFLAMCAAAGEIGGGS